MRTRRQVLKVATWLAVAVALEHVAMRRARGQTEGMNAPSETSRFDPGAGVNAWSPDHASNFKAIYGDPRLRAAFLLFLKNVYNIYPEDRFHELIADATVRGQSDREIYALCQAQQSRIAPFLSPVRYALPALARQKAEMASETLALLGANPRINGYMEIGTTGRYIGRLRSYLQLSGDLVLVNAVEPGYSPTDVVERGQLSKIGRYVPLKDYAPIDPTEVADESLDLVTNFIGFHHSPPARRDGFVRSIWRVLRPGGRLILRDHDVDSAPMNHMVALAHDVFNMGLGAPWQSNQREIRNFTSVAEITRELDRQGFRRAPGKSPQLQPGDPTRNALMEFAKV